MIGHVFNNVIADHKIKIAFWQLRADIIKQPDERAIHERCGLLRSTGIGFDAPDFGTLAQLARETTFSTANFEYALVLIG